ncbi:hypothetical protein YPPY45_2665 [Yersinia pestis PY-45]|nr:hypothetical protein YPPY07_2667 [Yersinia pestis PY-07]EIR91815.1 hypothetical protein YPPY45_2665 [Yersinia pestis PY-45]EIS31469.1 hypothetical protein YPPY56_2824 [Yersinia pestis PY-56]EIT40193.1 hypothetical protein YPPY99_2888 [Yersinia pestis PY-99]EIT55167.1 hypothetical protein YPPY102_2779 [Yersinia pestis PY-102]
MIRGSVLATQMHTNKVLLPWCLISVMDIPYIFDVAGE